MATLKIFDEADEFRIEIAGLFTGGSVSEVESHWRKVLSKVCTRRLTVDISRLSGYEAAGRKLLRHMHQHGATVAASTPRSLIFLAEITAAARRGPLPEPVQMREEPAPTRKSVKSAVAGRE